MPFLFVLLAASLLGAPADRYASVAVNADGSVTVNTEDGRQITPPRVLIDTGSRIEQSVGATDAAVSPDHQSVGWIALFDFCCTSYPIPLKLVIFSNGRLIPFSGTEPIWFWSFQDGGRRVAAREEMLHGDPHTHYELWDVRSGRRIGVYHPEYDESTADPKGPEWVKALDAAEAKSR